MQWPCSNCPWDGFTLSPENQDALSVYGVISDPLVLDCPVALEFGMTALDLEMTRGEVRRLWDRLKVIHEFVKAQAEG